MDGWIQSIDAELTIVCGRWRSLSSFNHLQITDQQFKLAISRKQHWMAVLNNQDNRFAIQVYLLCFGVFSHGVPIKNSSYSCHI